MSTESSQAPQMVQIWIRQNLCTERAPSRTEGAHGQTGRFWGAPKKHSKEAGWPTLPEELGGNGSQKELLLHRDQGWEGGLTFNQQRREKRVRSVEQLQPGWGRKEHIKRKRNHAGQHKQCWGRILLIPRAVLCMQQMLKKVLAVWMLDSEIN